MTAEFTSKADTPAVADNIREVFVKNIMRIFLSKEEALSLVESTMLKGYTSVETDNNATTATSASRTVEEEEEEEEEEEDYAFPHRSDTIINSGLDPYFQRADELSLDQFSTILVSQFGYHELSEQYDIAMSVFRLCCTISLAENDEANENAIEAQLSASETATADDRNNTLVDNSGSINSIIPSR